MANLEHVVFKVGKQKWKLGPRQRLFGTQCRLRAADWVYQIAPLEMATFENMCRTAFSQQEGVRERCPMSVLAVFLENFIPEPMYSEILDDLLKLREMLDRTYRRKGSKGLKDENDPGSFKWWLRTPAETHEELLAKHQKREK